MASSLAERGIGVTLFDRNERLLNRKPIANEGKVHLGCMYANDPSLTMAPHFVEVSSARTLQGDIR
ncbi:MAG: hypothetical protein HZB49_16535 [Bradyrhizobium sp.]|nr:hypothetical protein [Bradyrhizobium sp.]